MTGSHERPARPLPRIHLVTHDELLAGPDFGDLAAALLETGAAAVALHLRARRLPGRKLYQLAERLRPLARASGAWLVVNDRLDIALACDADGVQLGERSFPPGIARRLLGGRMWIGASVHDPERATRAAAEGADFLVAGTLYESATHPGRVAAGTAWIGDAASTGLPVIGIGGITPERTPSVLAAGAHGIALIRGVWGAPRPTDALDEYLRALQPQQR